MKNIIETQIQGTDDLYERDYIKKDDFFIKL
ncbi:hypothetical protein CLOBY_26830 [Clostridium saccharobutylicum]|nr:hypothetical protein CLOBY_26830 [Clostridium saccharobutylicum]NSB90846.1 hypothetical protein [Clostridium saccharobutylicum]NYC31492.1 hypothetical protein [Clostridium saccharobutylicum]OOM18431.1 hypothetical protein CLSAB_07280 [Clostridium saccharobutylicum]